MNDLRTQYRITEDDYVGAMKLYSRMTPRLVLIFLLVFAMLATLALFGSPVFRGGAIGGLIGGVFVIVFFRYIANPLLARSHYRKYKAIQEDVDIRLTEQGVELSTLDGGGLLKWDKIFKWRQNDRYVLIYPMPRLYHIILKSIADSGFDIAALTTALEKQVGKES